MPVATPIAATDEQLAIVRYDDAGLVPAIVQEEGTGAVLMMAWMNAETLRMSLTILANHLVSRDGLARVARAQGDLARAVRIYRQLLSSGPEQRFTSVFEPRYVLELARLLEKTGDGRGALKEYERFLQFWAHADADSPERAEAGRAVARLSVTR